jgi:hypothetical protein
MQRGPIVLVGDTQDEHVDYVRRKLTAFGETPLVINPAQFPAELQLSLRESAAEIYLGEERLAIPRAVYVRSLHADPVGYGSSVDDAMQRNWRATNLALRERGGVLSGILLRWEALGVPIYNSLESGSSTLKPYQLALLASAGLPLPKTLWTNDPAQARRFCSEHAAIYKPVLGGALTRNIAADDLTEERLARLRSAPVCFQEALPGRDIRVYVLDGRVICAMCIHSTDVDFRAGFDRIEPITLPKEVADWCVVGAARLGLRFSGIDLKEDGSGKPKFLEFNPSPMFQGFELHAGVEICEPLCRALINAGQY